jgi:hypothetical protein
MPANKSEQQLENRLINRIEALERNVRDLKTAQPIGADVLRTAASDLVTVSPVTIAAGVGLTSTATFNPSVNILSLWNFKVTLYIDGTTSADIFPNGANITSGMRKCTLMQWIDYAESTDSINTTVFKVRARNDDTVSHDYKLVYKAYLPYGTLG